MFQGQRLLEVRLAAILEEQTDIGQQGWLVILGCKQVVSGTFLDQVASELALGEQGIGGEGLACDIHALDQRDEHPDLVGLFEYIGAVYGQSGDFFWV